MIRHYLELAWQQLTKYHLQSVVSIVSLAIGFACFALASMWIKYETTYDAFHKDAEKLYVITQNGQTTMYLDYNPRIFCELPQFEQSAYTYTYYIDSINGRAYYQKGEWLMNDTNFVSFIGLDILEGSRNFMHNEHEVAISDKLAKRLWKDESPIGKEITRGSDKNPYKRTSRVGAVFRSWQPHSNYHLDILGLNTIAVPETGYGGLVMMAHIPASVDIEALNAHLDTMQVSRKFSVDGKIYEREMRDCHLKAIPITKLRQIDRKATVRLNHIYVFSIASSLLVLCGLLNYLTMFINRLFIRKREIALRTVFGATGRDLIIQFLIEYGLLLIIALSIGLFIIEASLDEFCRLAELPQDMAFFYRESFIYASFVSVVSLLLSFPPIWYFRRQSLQSSITGTGGLTRYNIFRRFSTGLQICISLFCVFCTVVLMKQLDTLRYGNIGFERENRMLFCNYYDEGLEDEILHFLKQCPEVETAFICKQSIYPLSYSRSESFPHPSFPASESLNLRVKGITPELIDFYGLQLLQGRWPNEGESNVTLVNGTLARHLGWKEPLKETLKGKQVVGVVKDFLNVSPTSKAQYYRLEYETGKGENILLRYQPGSKQRLMEKIEAFYKERGYIFRHYVWSEIQSEYDRMLQGELNLQKLLNIITGVCILIALFGVWSMIMLTCEQRRKEIAVRKVFGATTKDILDMFIVEYMALQGVAALVAFPIGYACMKPWLEQYVVQTEIPWWIYVGIFLMVALLVALCVGWRVWKTATAHPADEICKG